MQNVLINMCEKLHNDQLRNNRALGNRKSDTTTTTSTRRTTFIALGDSFPGPTNSSLEQFLDLPYRALVGHDKFLLFLC